MIALRVALFGASVGAIFFPSEFRPPFVAYEELSNYRFAIREKMVMTQMAWWFILCTIPASCFVLSLILKSYSRRAFMVLIPWTAAMLPSGFLFTAALLFSLFSNHLGGLPFWPTVSVLVGSILAMFVGWCVLLRWPRFREVTGDRPGASLLAVLLGGGYVAFLAYGGIAAFVFHGL